MTQAKVQSLTRLLGCVASKNNVTVFDFLEYFSAVLFQCEIWQHENIFVVKLSKASKYLKKRGEEAAEKDLFLGIHQFIIRIRIMAT